jgi:energy-coupling factor transporter ATP-binding protein EcfA2
LSLSLEKVTYRYAGAAAPVLFDVDLTLEPGRILGLIGRNGAGKSTLCICAVGLAPRTIGGELGGRVTIDGLDTASASAPDLAQRAGILFQETHTQLSGAALTVWEEVAFGPRNLALPLDEIIERTEQAIEAMGIGSIIERDPARLSGGQAQLVALAGVLALRPRYLILDEPTSQLDPLGTNLVGESLARAAKSTGAGILIVEHKTDLLARLCDDVAVIDGGRMVARGHTAEILGSRDLEAWGVGQPAATRLRGAVESAGLIWQQEWT